MKKTPNYIKKTLIEAKQELLKNQKLNETRELYVQKMKEIFQEEVIDLKDGIETKMSFTGTDKSTVISRSDSKQTFIQPKKVKDLDKKIIFLNNEIVDQNLSSIDEANNELMFNSESIIELKNEVISSDEKIIHLNDEVENIIELKEEVIESQQLENEDQILLKDEIKTKNEETIDTDLDNIQEKEKSADIEELEMLNEKVQDLDLNNNELTEKLDELLDQKNLFSDKFNNELDIKLTEALNRSEDNLENKLNNITDNYHQEFSKYEDEANKNFANLEDQIGQLNNQFDSIQNNINLMSSKIEEGLNKISDPIQQENLNIEKRFNEKISDLNDYNLKIENSLNNLNNRIEETLDKISSYKNDINQKIENLEPELINKIEEKQKNKTESEKLQDKFDQMSKIMDMQNMRMLQMYHSSELQYSHSILQKNLDKKSSNKKDTSSPEMMTEELQKKVFPKIQEEMDKQFDLLKTQLSEFEIKSVLDKINSNDINKEFKRATKRFDNLFDAKKYVKSTISKKSRDWIKENESSIDEIAKKLLIK